MVGFSAICLPRLGVGVKTTCGEDKQASAHPTKLLRMQFVGSPGRYQAVYTTDMWCWILERYKRVGRSAEEKPARL